MEIKKDNLEDALNKKDEAKQEVSKEMDKQGISKEMEIGFHQGALNTLLNERNELFKIIQQVEQVMKAHMKRLEELGIKIQFKKEEEKK
ncbi:hypothetical protein M0R19_02475 [Candidatus Pacearchaeota archaeon]|nr:hypothetical protein [Candidatus Pacearchaeota archaeon]